MFVYAYNGVDVDPVELKTSSASKFCAQTPLLIRYKLIEQMLGVDGKGHGERDGAIWAQLLLLHSTPLHLVYLTAK
jgi:hypothetical protein